MPTARKRVMVNVGTEEIFPARILKFGGIFKGWKKNSISLCVILTIYMRVRHVRMAQFFVKIAFLVQKMGTSP